MMMMTMMILGIYVKENWIFFPPPKVGSVEMHMMMMVMIEGDCTVGKLSPKRSTVARRLVMWRKDIRIE